jgi:hypothetical protein
MRTGITFAKDWQLIKLARSMRRHDVSGPIVRRLISEAHPELLLDIVSIAERLGAEDGAILLEHASERFEPATLMEGILLMWGIPCELPDDDAPASLTIRMDGPALRAAFADERIAVPYLSGYVKAIAPGASLAHQKDTLTIEFPAGT